MKKLITTGIVWSISLCAMTQGIAFEHGNFAAVCAKAKAENKLIFIDVYTSWCGPCKHMAETVFKQENVGQLFNTNFISYKIDAEKGEGKAIAARYFVQYYPTYLFIDHNGALFNKGIGACKDSAFLAIAATAKQEFADMNSLPRLKAQYATQKKDTAFLNRYLDKLLSAKIHAYEIVEQYLRVQTAMPENSPAMLTFLKKCSTDLCYGGKAAQILASFENQFKKTTDTPQLKWLAMEKNILFYNTRTYAVESKSIAMIKTFLAAREKQDDYQRATLPVEKIWLDYYSATGDWKQYRPLANRWLDSISSRLHPIANTDDKNFFRKQSPEEREMKIAAGLVSTHAKIYSEHFSDEKGVVQKALRWVAAADRANSNNYAILTVYASLLYANKDTALAISNKIKAINSLPATSLHRPLAQTNLQHMQHNEPLEEE